MNKKIEDVFDLPPMESQSNSSYPTDEEEQDTGLNLIKTVSYTHLRAHET